MLLTGLLSLLSYVTQDYLPRDGTTHSGLGYPHIIQQSRKCPSDIPTDQSDGDSTSIEIPVFQAWLSLGQLN